MTEACVNVNVKHIGTLAHKRGMVIKSKGHEIQTTDLHINFSKQ